MPSHLIIGSHENSKKLISQLSPFPISNQPDCFIVEKEDSLKISQVREIKKFLNNKPFQNDNQVVLISDADRLTIPAQNALLKTLEEPPSHAIIILTSQHPDRLLPTILSRCSLHQAESQKINSSHQEFDQILKSLTKASIPDRVCLAQDYAYPKTKATNICKEAILYFHQQLINSPSQFEAHNAALAQTTLNRIEQNVDPKLSIEHFFIHLKGIIQL